MIRILIVDDEPLTREYVAALLEKEAPWAQLFTAENGVEALKLIEREDIHFVLTDIRMPEMDGLALAEALHRGHPSVRVAILSGYEDFNYAQQALQYRVVDYLLKPINKTELLQMLHDQRAQIEKSRVQNQTYLNLLRRMNDYEDLVAKTLLQAVLREEGLKIRQYYEIAHCMGIGKLQSLAAIMVLELSFPLDEIPVKEYPAYKMLLLQDTEKVLKAEKFEGVCFADAAGSIVVYLANEDERQLIQQQERLCEKLRGQMDTMMVGALRAGFGLPEQELLHMDRSYRGARNALTACLLGNHAGFCRDNGKTLYDELIRYLREVSRRVLTTRGDGDVIQDASVRIASILPDKSLKGLQDFCIFAAQALYHLDESRAERYPEQMMVYLQSVPSESACAADWQEHIFRLLMAYFHENPPDESKASQLAKMAQSYILAHYNEPISLSLLAEKVRVSESYFSSIFSREAGESYIKYLTRVRMEKAAELLHNQPPLKVYEVASAVGYYNAKHFISVFKQWYGMTPAKYQGHCVSETADESEIMKT